MLSIGDVFQTETHQPQTEGTFAKSFAGHLSQRTDSDSRSTVSQKQPGNPCRAGDVVWRRLFHEPRVDVLGVCTKKLQGPSQGGAQSVLGSEGCGVFHMILGEAFIHQT